MEAIKGKDDAIENVNLEIPDEKLFVEIKGKSGTIRRKNTKPQSFSVKSYKKRSIWGTVRIETSEGLIFLNENGDGRCFDHQCIKVAT
jgi:hypothetical protein